MDTAIIMCRMDLNEIVSRNLKEQKTFCTFTRQKKAARDILFAAPLYSRGSSPRLIMSIQLNVKVGDADATLGTSASENGDTVYILSWEQGGVSNTIMGNISRDEIMKIAENVF